MNRLSIKMRVTAWFTVVMLVVATVMFFLMVGNRIRQITVDAEQSLVKNATIFATDIARRPEVLEDDQKKAVPPNATASNAAKPPEDDGNDPKDRASHTDKPNGLPMNMYGKGIHYAVYDENESLIMGTIPFDFEDLQFHEGKVRTVVSESEKYLVFDKKVQTKDGQTVWVKGVTNLSAALNAVNVTKTSDFLIIAILILFAAGGGYLIVKQALIPVHKMSITAREISESNNLSRRIGLGEGKDEIYQLAGVLDNMLDRIESSFESEKQFTSDASHELRTPVSVIVSECEYALECAKTDEEYKEAVEVIKRQAEKMSQLISALLMISRMDRSMMEIDFEKVNVSKLLETICEEQAEMNEVPLKTQITENVFVMADEMLLARLFINLISNAFEYGSTGEYIHVSLGVADGKMIFSVEDHGVGIPADEVDRIWERFYRVNKARNSQNGNMGLGLSMVKEIAQIHKGSVSVKSELGKGSTFNFTMPLGI